MKIKKFLFLFALMTMVLSCDNDDDATNNVCDDFYVDAIINTTFTPANDYQLIETMDLQTHEYKMKINENGEICTIGYKNPNVYAGDYTMEVINETTNNSYSAVHSFSQTQIDYQPIAPVTVNAGDVILVRRTINNNASLNETVGQIFHKTDYSNPFPEVQGNIEFLESDFYGMGGPVPNYGMPYIPVGFKVI